MPRLLELFCGTKSVGKEFAKAGFDVLSLDIDPQFRPDICADILTVKPEDFESFDVFWASPPCDAFSVMVIGRNWNHDDTPKTDEARHGLKILTRTVEILTRQLELNPKLLAWIENPRAKMRKMPILQIPGFTRKTVTYCQYGDTRMKPTDLWTNTNWQPRAMCKNGDTCHDPAPRGSKQGTQVAEFAASRLISQIAVQPVAKAGTQIDLFGEL